MVNIDKLWSLLPVEEREKHLKQGNKEIVPVIDVLAHGYSKVLGKGQLPEVPLIVKARFVSALAEKRIKEAGGVIKLVA